MYSISEWESLVVEINQTIMKYESLEGDQSSHIEELKERRGTALAAIRRLKG